MVDQAPMADGGGGFADMPTWQKGVLVGGVALGAFLLYRRYKSSQSSASTGQDTTGTTTSGPIVDPATGNLINPLTGMDYTQSAPAAPTDNNGWLLSAEQAAIHAGINPGLADQALSNFLNGNPLSNQQAGVINTLLGKVGFPPIQVPFLGNPTPTPAKPTKPAQRGFQWELVNNVWRQVRFASQDTTKKVIPPILRRPGRIPARGGPIPLPGEMFPLNGGAIHSVAAALGQSPTTVRPHVAGVGQRPTVITAPPRATGVRLLNELPRSR